MPSVVYEDGSLGKSGELTRVLGLFWYKHLAKPTLPAPRNPACISDNQTYLKGGQDRYLDFVVQ
jgi:hypothetical protein